MISFTKPSVELNLVAYFSTYFSTTIKAMLSILVIVYPVLIYFGLGVFNPRVIAVLLLLVFIIRFILMSNSGVMQNWGILAGAAVIVTLAFVFNDPLYLKFYPVMVSALMFSVFTMSLIKPPSIIERFAKLHYKGQDLPAHVVVYTHNVTKIWCVFFVLNGLVALYTVQQSMEVWTLYNGLISYLLMGSLFAGEFLFRHFIIKKRAGDA